ncbi:MAG: undecaprenyl-diphosphate phosphatase [Phycisphaerales bacterium]|nr:undecaprenyl-diphosphate phosphatase [Phycisphaerales bacterium]
MTPLDAIVLGIVEGITEYLPVSSTGHLILVSRLLGLATTEEARKSVDTFNIVVQGSAVLAVAGLYRREVRGMVRSIVASARLVRVGVNHREHLVLVRNLAVSFLPAAALGLMIDDWIDARFFKAGPVLAALALGGILMLALAPWVRQRSRVASETGVDGSTISVPQALLIGLLQCLALFPGTSRSMVTIIGSLLVGLPPREAARYSFLLALPTLGAACAYKSIGLIKTGGMIESLGGWTPVVLGLLAAFVSAVLSIKWLVGFLGRGGFALFGWWRLALAGAVALGLWQGWVPF